MTTLAVSADGPNAWEKWRKAFAEAAPELEVVSWFDPAFDAAKADYAYVWMPAPGEMARMSGMRAIFASSAGVNQFVGRDDLPSDVPLVRMGGDGTAALMADYVLWAAIGIMRDCRSWAVQQEQKLWKNNQKFQTCQGTRIGILGFGNLGAAVAQRLAENGFEVSAWCRREREQDPQVMLHFGHDGLPEFLSSLDLLVNLLPSTPQTRGLMNAEMLKNLKAGAGFINVGRGDLVVEDDLLAALDSGHVSRAVLDVFVDEPLGEASRFWSHPQVTVTPHVASEASPFMQAQYVADCIREMEAGGMPKLVYRSGEGY